MEMIAGVVQRGAKKPDGRESLRGLDGKKKRKRCLNFFVCLKINSIKILRVALLVVEPTLLNLL
jgi:hypothetical protein